MIITGGLKVMPVTLESILRPYLSSVCEDFYISSLPDEIWSSRIVLVCIPLEHTKLSDKEQILKIRHIIDCIPLTVLQKKFRPKEICLRSEFPMTSSGKLLRRLI